MIAKYKARIQTYWFGYLSAGQHCKFTKENQSSPSLQQRTVYNKKRSFEKFSQKDPGSCGSWFSNLNLKAMNVEQVHGASLKSILSAEYCPSDLPACGT